MTAKYHPFLDALNKKLGGTTENEVIESMEEEEEEEEEENVQTGQKRKRKRKYNWVSKRSFLDNEAEVSGSDDSDDNEEEDESDDQGLIIDDSSDVEENNASYYRALDNAIMVDSSQPDPSTAPQPSPPSSSVLTDEEYEVETKRLKKIKAFLSKLTTYIGQIMILGFNSQKYDIPLIRPYLPSSIIKTTEHRNKLLKESHVNHAVRNIPPAEKENSCLMTSIPCCDLTLNFGRYNVGYFQPRLYY